MSHRATISPCLPASLVSLSPLPPTPMHAKRTLSSEGDGGRTVPMRRNSPQVRARAGGRGLLEKLTTVHGDGLRGLRVDRCALACLGAG